ncbi:hypothetical protein GAH_00219 [Geoglobus ahangari]|uniref:Phosphodiesterase n=1 Tax=Geoglobus ahangari TaxID=113653 RepID=A0A0F7II31_9EURY|nr:alkaline phosphatase family protein [Geoglobus ahangari]AKG92424.1 hypothetical protein GAH_00219 [Geoglobus ahangari]
MSKPKVFVIGLDGATWDVILPLVERGELPTFKKLIENGAWGVLKSTIPPVTIPAWPAFVTGKNPGKFGVFDFFVVDENGESRIVTSKDIKSKKLWDYLGFFGLKSIVVNLPNSYPVEKINGVMVSGMLTPEGKPFAYPPEVEEIAKEIGYVIEVDSDVIKKYRGKYELINELLRIIDKRFRFADYLLKRYKCDFFFILVRETDIIQHSEFKNLNKIATVYKYIDSKISEFIDRYFDDNTIFILMSDHGFSPLNKHIYINNLLYKNKLLKINNQKISNNKNTDIIYRVLLKLGITKKDLGRIFKKFKLDKIVVKILPLSLLGSIPTSVYDVDMKESVAYFGGKFGMESTYILINKQKFSTKEEYETTRTKIIEILKKVKDPKTGKPVITRVFKGEELFNGEFSSSAPDLVILLEKGYSMNASITKDGTIIEEIPLPSGTHDTDGIVLFYGRDIKPTKLDDATIYDLMPTILHIFGLPIPNDVDGKILRSVFRENSEIATRDPSIIDVAQYREMEEKDKIRRKIQKLKII